MPCCNCHQLTHLMYTHPSETIKQKTSIERYINVLSLLKDDEYKSIIKGLVNSVVVLNLKSSPNSR